MMQIQIHYCGAVIMLTDVQAYCVTFSIFYFDQHLPLQPPIENGGSKVLHLIILNKLL